MSKADYIRLLREDKINLVSIHTITSFMCEREIELLINGINLSIRKLKLMSNKEFKVWEKNLCL